MKHIIFEGGDNLGKDTLIKGVCEYFNYDNLTIRHFGKPPKGLAPKETLDFQFDVFYKEMLFKDYITDNIDGDEFGYYPNTLIWNRSHLGEYVYSQMFRGITKREIKEKIRIFEERNVSSQMYLITLTADPVFFLSKEDGHSFSQDLEQKTRELELFKEAHNLSIIPNKKLLRVDRHGQFKSKETLLFDVLDFLKEV